MSGKTQLQQNNIIISTILDTINGLPLIDDVKHGKYSWGKYSLKVIKGYLNEIADIEEYFVRNHYEFTTYREITITNGVATGIDDYIVSESEDFIYSGEYITSEEYPYCVYDGIAYVDVNISRNAMYLQGTEIVIKKGDFIEAVVSDTAEKYPDDGELDGYYYEKQKLYSNYGMFTKEFNIDGYPLDLLFRYEKVVQNMFLAATNSTSFSIMNKVSEIEIETTSVGIDGFKQFFYYCNTGKLKLKVSSIDKRAFSYYGKASNAHSKVWISNKCTNIWCSAYTDSPFYLASLNASIYCEHTSKPSTWSNYFNYLDSLTVGTTVWGVSESEFDNM